MGKAIFQSLIFSFLLLSLLMLFSTGKFDIFQVSLVCESGPHFLSKSYRSLQALDRQLIEARPVRREAARP